MNIDQISIDSSVITTLPDSRNLCVCSVDSIQQSGVIVKIDNTQYFRKFEEIYALQE